MRYKRLCKSMNLILVAVVSLSLAIGQPGYLYASECTEAAEDAYADALDGFEAAIAAGEADHEAAIADINQTLWAVGGMRDALVGICEVNYARDIMPYDAGLTAALIAIGVLFAAAVAICWEAPPCLALAAIDAAIWAADAYGVYTVATQDINDTHTYCVGAANALYDEAMGVATTDTDEADAALATIISDNSAEGYGPTQAAIAYYAALDACDD